MGMTGSFSKKIKKITANIVKTVRPVSGAIIIQKVRE